jgi:NAD(P)H dehydrogenase (quinone)
MAKVLVAYYTRTKHTLHMAEAVAEGAQSISGAKVTVKPVGQFAVKELLDYDAIIIGSPTYYGTMAAEVKKLFDDSVVMHGRLDGKVGGAFATSANVGGGNETTVLDIIKAMLIHGMVIQGSPGGDHYGPCAIGDVDQRSREECVKLGRICAELAVKLHG